MAAERGPGAAGDPELERRLASALRRGADGGAVDVVELVEGTRARVGVLRHRRRQRRLVGTALAVVLLGAVPVAVQVLPGPDPRTQVATAPETPGLETPGPEAPAPEAPGPSALGEPGPPEAVPTGPAEEPVAPGSGRAGVAYDIPDLPRTWAALPGDLELLLDLGQYANVSVVDGQACNEGRAGLVPVAGRSWSWAEEDSNRLDQVSVGVTVTGWAEGAGAEAFTEVVDDTGRCRFPGSPETVPVDVDADDSWAATSQDGSGALVLSGAARTGDLLVGVSVHGMELEPGRRQVESLLRAAVAELRASGLPAAGS